MHGISKVGACASCRLHIYTNHFIALMLQNTPDERQQVTREQFVMVVMSKFWVVQFFALQLLNAMIRYNLNCIGVHSTFINPFSRCILATSFRGDNMTPFFNNIAENYKPKFSQTKQM